MWVPDTHLRCFGGPDDEWGFPTMWFGRVPERLIMAHEVFGFGDFHPACPPRQLTRDEFERYARWTADFQRRLQTDRSAKFGPPTGETWPPDPNAPPVAPLAPRAQEMEPD